MPKKKYLARDIVSGKLSRLQYKDLPLIGIDGLTDGDHILPFGQSLTDIIEYCVYDLSDNYLASGELEHPLPTDLDVGAHVRSLGFERGTYKIVYNFLRQVGGSNKFILTKKSDKSVYTDEFMIGTSGKVLASYNPESDMNVSWQGDDDSFDDDELIIEVNTTANDIDGWDSLTHIRLVITIEKAFDLRFTAAEISELENVGEMVELIVKLS